MKEQLYKLKNHVSWINAIGFIAVMAFLTYILLYGKYTYTADRCVSGYQMDGTSVTAAPGDKPDLMICNYAAYLPAGKYTIRIDGYNEYKEYNMYELYSYDYGGIIAKDVFVPGQDIYVVLDRAIKDLDVRVYYQDAGTVTVSKVTIERCRGVKTYLIAFLGIALATAVYILICKYKNTVFAKVVTFIIGALTFILAVIAQFIFIETIYQNDTFYHRLSLWLLSGEREAYLVVLSCVILALIDILIILVCKYYSIAIPVCTILSGVFALVGYNYFISRGDVFTFSQLRLAKDAARVVGEYDIYIPGLFWKGLILSVIFSLPFVGKFIVKKWEHRLVCAIPLVAAICVAILNVKPAIAKRDGHTIVFIADNYYDNKGFLLGTIVMLPNSIVKPENYSEDMIRAIVSDYELEDSFHGMKDKPTIIYVQCETLFDMTYVTEQTWSENPLEYLDTLKENYYVGNLVSPVAGGGTCNVEYEMLTGYSFYNAQETPFVSELTKGEPSFISNLNDYGYETVAIHTNTGAFFNRENAYDYLGFDEMLFKEQLGDTPDEYMLGTWANDQYAYEVLINNYEERDKSKPYFAHVVTTQNHGPFDTSYDEQGITVDGDLDIEANRKLQTYLNLEKESMIGLDYLLNYFSSVDENVIIVFWGDHCPSLQLFDVNGDTADYVVNSHKTPLVVWNNYGASFSFDDTLCAYQFTPILMQQLGMRNDLFMNYSSENNVPTVVVGAIDIEDDNSYISVDQMSEEKKAVKDNLWLLQYDREYGKRYSNLQ